MTNRTMIVMAAGAVGAVFVVLLARLFAGRKLDAWLKETDRRILVAGIIVAVVSGVLYSVVHEFGHYIFAIALGGTVRAVTWTMFGKGDPHVSYSALPPSAVPWASAGGYLVPTALALVLITIWYGRRRRWSPLSAIVLLMPAAIMLLANTGVASELFRQHSHVGKFTSYYGMGTIGETLISFLIAFASIAILIAVFLTLKNIKNAPRGVTTPSGKLARLTGTIGVCLLALLACSHAAMIFPGGLNFKSNYVVSEEDEWTVVSGDEIRVHSTLAIRKFPETYEDLILTLPFAEATVQKIRLGEKEVAFSCREPDEYHVDLSSHQNTAESGIIRVLWTLSPAVSLTPSKSGKYSIPFNTLVPADSFSLTVTIEEGSGFQFSFGDPEAHTARPFNASYGQPRMDLGHWTGLMKKKDKDTGDAQQADPVGPR